jgi:hypothetical protein
MTRRAASWKGFRENDRGKDRRQEEAGEEGKRLSGIPGLFPVPSA